MSADIDSEIAAAEQKAQESGKLFSGRLKDQHEDDRSVIAKIIVRTFVVLVVIVVVAVILGTYLLDWDRISEPVKALVTILGSVMLPVVTLVIGYYFGSK